MENKPQVKRKNYLISKAFQFRYAGIILFVMFFVSWVTGYTIYYTGWLLMGEKLANVYPQGRLMSIMSTINTTLLIRLFLITPIVILVSILLSHRIAGPIYRIQKYLKEVAKGDLSARLHLRKDDELQEFAACVNEMTDDLNNRINKIKGLVNTASIDLDRLTKALDKEVPGASVAKKELEGLEKSIKELASYLSEYRLTTIED